MERTEKVISHDPYRKYIDPMLQEIATDIKNLDEQISETETQLSRLMAVSKTLLKLQENIRQSDDRANQDPSGDMSTRNVLYDS